jgi:hypothetical protein
VRAGVLSRLTADPAIKDLMTQLEEQVASGTTAPSLAADAIVARMFPSQ